MRGATLLAETDRVEGVAVAALEQDPTAQVAVQCWRARRNAGIGASRLRVGHVDIVATPG